MPFLSADSLSLVDIVMLAIIVIGLPLETVINLKKVRATLTSGAPDVRVKHYTSTIMLLWGLAIPILVLWAVSNRGWDMLGFQIETGQMPLVGWSLAGLMVAFFIFQYAMISTSEGARLQLRDGIAGNKVMAGFMPQRHDERHLFNLLGITAGITEEIIFRGYLIWAFSLVMPLWAAALASLIVFTFLHLYQGAKNLPAIFIIGGALTLVFVLSGSIWPAIAVHIFVDILNNQTVWRARSVAA